MVTPTPALERINSPALAPAIEPSIAPSHAPAVEVAPRLRWLAMARAMARAMAALARVAMALAILCATMALAIVALQEGRAAGWGLGGPLPSPLDPAMQAPALGVTVELDGRSDAAQTAALERLATAGVGWVRLRADWSMVEATRGDFDWTALDGQIQRIVASGMEAVVVLDNSPAWARAPVDGGLAIAPPVDPTDFATFAGVFARRYGNQVRYYQIWDEPNIAPHWGSRHVDPIGYTQMLRSAAAAIRTADEDAVILSAALAPTNDRGHLAIDEAWFLQRMLAAGARGSFDAVAAEPFGFGQNPSQAGPSARRLDFQRLTQIRRALLAAGLGEVPVWAVRFGWNTRSDSPWRTVTPDAQSRYAAEARTVAARWPWLATLGWAVDQPSKPAADPAWGFALNDSLLAALTSTPQIGSTPDRTSPAFAMALWLATAAAATVLAWPSVRALPVASARRLYIGLPAWQQIAVWTTLLVVYHLATWPPLILLCWIAGALLVAATPISGIFVALVCLPFYFLHKEIALGDATVPVAPHVAVLLMLVPVTLAGAWRALRAESRFWRSWTWNDYLVTLWLALGVISAAGAWHVRGYLAGMAELVLAPALLYVAIRLFASKPGDARRALIALFAGGLLVAGLGLVRWLAGDGVEIDGVRRLVGPHFSPNHTALYLLRTLFVGVGLALASQGRRRAVWMAAVALVAVALTMTASRGALILGIPGGLLVFAWLWWRTQTQPIGGSMARLFRRRSLRFALVLAPVVVLGLAVVGEARLFNGASVDSRLLLWQASLRLAGDVFWTGVGPDGFFWRYPAYLPMGTLLEPSLRHPHNVWLEMATGWGFLGLVWVIALYAGWLISSARRVSSLSHARQWPVIGLTAAAVAALAHAQVDALLALPDLAAWLFAALGIFAALVHDEKQTHEPG